MVRTRAQARMLKAVGLVAEQTALVEEELRETMCAFLGGYGHVLGGGQMLGTLIENCFRLANYSRLDDEQYEAFTAILKEADRLRTERNSILHARWESAGGGRHLPSLSKAVSRSPRTPGIYGGKERTPEEVIAIAGELEAVAAALVEFRADAFNRGYTTPPFPRGFRMLPSE